MREPRREPGLMTHQHQKGYGMKPRRPNRWIARYSGVCDLCGDRIHAGTDWISRRAGQNVHTLCHEAEQTAAVRRKVDPKAAEPREVPDVLKGLV